MAGQGLSFYRRHEEAGKKCQEGGTHPDRLSDGGWREKRVHFRRCK
jgi:hypothetical protein